MVGVSDDPDAEAEVAWRRRPPAAVSPPIARWLPYLEVKLEHPALEATARGERFFPDAVPYTLDDTDRVFYWRPALSGSGADPEQWVLAGASTHELRGLADVPAAAPTLVDRGAEEVTLVVEGTVGGETTTARVESYEPPAVRVAAVDEDAVHLQVDGRTHAITRTDRRRIALDERSVVPVGSAGGPTTVTPELVVRFPGRRELHHPAPGADYCLFPGFGLSLDALPNPLPVATAAGELDHGALAASLGVDLSERPYPERVLWQAFAFTAFDPHGEGVPELTQLGDGRIVLRARPAGQA